MARVPGLAEAELELEPVRQLAEPPGWGQASGLPDRAREMGQELDRALEAQGQARARERVLESVRQLAEALDREQAAEPGHCLAGLTSLKLHRRCLPVEVWETDWAPEPVR